MQNFMYIVNLKNDDCLSIFNIFRRAEERNKRPVELLLSVPGGNLCYWCGAVSNEHSSSELGVIWPTHLVVDT